MQYRYMLVIIYLALTLQPKKMKITTKTYPSWHSKTSLVGENISNIRPLAKVPMLNVTDNENPKLWATNHEFKLCSLGNGKPDQYGAFEVLTPEHTIHALGRDLPKRVSRPSLSAFRPCL